MKAEVEISFEQIIGMVSQLDDSQKNLLAEELQKSVRSDKLNEILKSFRGASITQDEIDNICEEIREEINDQRSDKSHH